MAVLAPQTIISAGLGPTYVSANVGGDTITDAAAVATGGVFIHAKNASGGALTVTIADPGSTPMGNVGTAVAVSVPAAGERMIPVPPAAWNPGTAQVSIAYSGVASLTVGAFRR